VPDNSGTLGPRLIWIVEQIMAEDEQTRHLGGSEEDFEPADVAPVVIERHFLTLCDGGVTGRTLEMEEIYSMLRRRPEGRSLGASRDFMWQVAALLLGTHVLSEAEFLGICAALDGC